MTAPGVIAGARHVLRVQRRQRTIVVASARRQERKLGKEAVGLAVYVALQAVLPAAAAFAAWQKSMASSADRLSPWVYVAVIATFLGSGHVFQSSALSFAARDVLFLPDKAAVLMARLVRALPLLVGIGGAWALAVWLCLGAEQAAQPLAVAACCAVAAVAPLAWNIGALLQRIVAPDAGSVATPAGLLAVCGVYLLDPLHWAGGNVLRWVELGMVMVLAALLLGGLVHGLVRTTRAGVQALWLELVRAPRVLVLAILLLPPVAWHGGAWLAVVAAIGLACITALLPFALQRLLVTVNGAEAETGAASIERLFRPVGAIDERPRRASEPAPHRGRSLWRATWRMHWLQYGISWRDLRRPWRPLAFLALHASGLATLGFVVWRGDPQLQLAALAPALFVLVKATVASRERLHLLGLDLREQARHQVATALCTVAAPCLLTGALVATTFGWTERRTLTLTAFAVAFLLRIGWRGLLPRPEMASERGAFVVIVLLATTCWVAASQLTVVCDGLATKTVLVQWPIVGGVAAIACVGLVRRVALWREPELLADLIAARERESRPSA